MIGGKFQDGIRTMLNFHVRRNSTDSPNSLFGSGGSTKWMGMGTPRGGSPGAEVGEIDTSAPFQSVRAAVSLFGEAVSPKNAASSPANKPRKPKTAEDQRVVEAIKELDNYKERLKNIEAAKAHARREVDKAKRTIQELTDKLQTISESKQAAIESAEASKERIEEIQDQNASSPGTATATATDATWKQNVDSQREQYRVSSAELISAKQELTMLRQDFDSALEAKVAAFQQAADAHHMIRDNQEKVTQISKEITSLRETLGQVKLATLEAQEQQNQHKSERESRLLLHARLKDQLELKMKSLKEENAPLLEHSPKILDKKLEETSEATKVLAEQLKDVRDSDISSLKSISDELNDAKRKLEEMVEEENGQRICSVDPLKRELDKLRRERSELQDKTTEDANRVQNLKAELETHKNQLLKAGEELIGPDDQLSSLNSQHQQLAQEAENSRREAEEIRKSIEVVRQDTETACSAAREGEERLKIVLNEVEEAKEAAKQAGDMIRDHSRGIEGDDEQEKNPSSSSSVKNGRIKLRVEEYEKLSKKADEARADADVKVATIMAQIETIKAREREALKKMEECRVEKEGMESAIEEALKQAEMADGAKQVVEGELLKWRQKESFN